MKAFGINGSTTNHGGVVIASQQMAVEEGISFLRAGDGFACPKCKCWSTLISSNSFIIIDGKPVAFVGDKFTCGAILLQKQSLVVGDNGAGSANSSQRQITSSLVSSKDDRKEKCVLELFWSYGDNHTRLKEFSRHYVDINLHVKTQNYQAGETLEITISGLENDILDGLQELKISGTVNQNDEVIINHIFKDKIINI